MSGPRTLNGKVVLPVYTLDNSMKTLLIEPTSTVHDVCRMVAEKIGFTENPEDDALCFSLNECTDGVTIGRALSPEREVLGIMEGWVGKPDAKFIYQCKLYTDGIIASKDAKVVHMLFIQGVYNVITGNYPSNDKEAIALAALQFQARFGPFNPASHKPGFLSTTLVEYIPTAHLMTKPGRTQNEWETAVFHKHAFSTTTTPREQYLALLSKRDYYGAVIFAVKQKYDRALPRKLYLGISRRGITLIKIPKSAVEDGMETVGQYPLADIFRWAYKPGVNFYFEIKSERPEEPNAVYMYETPEGKHMSDMLTDYALALLREMGLNPDGTKRVKASKPAAASTATAGAATGGSGASTASAGGAGASSSASVSAAPPAPLPSRDAMATSADAYKSVAGDVGSLASAALRSGQYADAGASEGATGGAGAEAGTVPPPPPSFTAPPPPPPTATTMPPPPPPSSEPAALPADWIECVDPDSGDKYFFNTATGESVWEIDDIPGYKA